MLAQGIAQVVVEKVSSTSIPFKPEDQIELPELSLEVHQMATGITPVWQQELVIDHGKVQQGMEHTAREAWKATLKSAETK